MTNNMDVQELYANGYRAGRPRPGIIDGGAIDADICATSTCEWCGHSGMEYKPFINNETKSYRAFTLCPKCGHTEEF